MRWRYLILLVCLILCLSGCLKRVSRGRSAASASQPSTMMTDSRSEDLPTPQLFDISLEPSHP